MTGGEACFSTPGFAPVLLCFGCWTECPYNECGFSVTIVYRNLPLSNRPCR
jgi:hypothetical protein